MIMFIYVDTSDKLKLLDQSSEEVIRYLLKILFHPETVTFYNLKPSLQKGRRG